MKRPIFVAIIGYILGIIVGLYLHISMVPFYLCFIISKFLYKKIANKSKIKSKNNNEDSLNNNKKIENKNTNSFKKKNKLKLFSIKRYFRYIKIFLNSDVIITIVFFSIISNSIVLIQNKEYEKIYHSLENQENIKLTGTVISNKQENQYYNKYKIRLRYQNKKINLYITTDKKTELEYGDKIIFIGEYIKPEVQRNYKGFDYAEFLKQLKIYGTVKTSNIEIIEKRKANTKEANINEKETNNNSKTSNGEREKNSASKTNITESTINKNNYWKTNILFEKSNDISNKIEKRTKEILDEETASILLGLILGDKTNIEDNIQENFRNASMSHILAISGMHITYIILGINFVFSKLIGKRKTYILCIFTLIFYMFITNFSPSVTRAGIMGILVIFSKLIYRKNDNITSMSISMFLILLYNPYLIQNLGVQLSFGAVIGILYFNKRILMTLKNIKIENKTYKYKIRPKISKIIDIIEESMVIPISAQIMILPILINSQNTFNTYFLISNLLLSFCIGPIVISSFIFIILVLINEKIAIIFTALIKLETKILILISNIGKLPHSKIYIPTPSLIVHILYYLIIFLISFLYQIYNSKDLNRTEIRIRNLIALLKIKERENKVHAQRILIIILVLLLIPKIIPQNLKIHFIDVGQGDSTFIITPRNKTILIDGGGSQFSDYDVGKNTLIPYLLDRGYSKIDMVIISHFDSDHIGGILTLLEELKVKKVIISKQKEESENFNKFTKIVKEKHIKVETVEAGERLKIEKNIYFDILWPNNSKIIGENSLNNNSIVCKLCYKNFSCLFTGDIEEIAENAILNEYKNTNLLKSDVIKIAHHGSKTSSTSEFIEKVNPKIALIGVGKNNKFGHPSQKTIQLLNERNIAIFRTDQNGEVSICVNLMGKIAIRSQIYYS